MKQLSAKDLRIGSIYHSVKWNKPVRLELSDLVELYHLCEFAELDSEIISRMFKPIELTEELLVKAGFRKLNDCTTGYRFVCKNGLCIDFFNEKLYCYIDSIGLDHIKYLHQLQNLAYDLNEELNIKL